MIVLALAGILVGLAVPSMRDFMRNGRLTSAANDMLHSLSMARTEAVKRQVNPVNPSQPAGPVIVCASASPYASNPTCSYQAMSGWIVFVDNDRNGQYSTNDELLGRGAASTQVTVKNDNNGVVCFDRTGFQPPNCGGQTPMAHVVICDSRGDTAIGTDSTARTVLVTRTGRARVSRLHADVSTALAAMGVGCP